MERISINVNLPGLLDEEGYLNMNITELKRIVNMFDSFWKQPPQSLALSNEVAQQPQPQQQFQLQMADAPFNVDSDDLFNLND